MKFLLLLAAILLAVWLWRSGRRADGEDKPHSPGTGDGPQEMVRCTLCGVHLPRSDVVPGRIGQYCSAEHRQAAEP